MWRFMSWGCFNMKCIKNFLISITICLVMFLSPVVADVCLADSETNITDFRVQIEAILKEFVSDKDRQNRYAGSQNEENASQYILEKMVSYGLVPVDNQSTKMGVQLFNIYTSDDGVQTSQNIIFKKTGKSSEKKVVIATHYDSEYYYCDEDDYTQKHGTEDVCGSGAGVATLLVLAQAMSYYATDFDVEFVFFGAHNENLAGSKYYTSFISDEDAENILLMINIDNVVSDGKVYLYNGEFKSKTDGFVNDTFMANFNGGVLSDYRIVGNPEDESITGLDYTHFAMESDNAHFVRVGVKTLSPVSISDENINGLGMVTYCPMLAIEKDTLSNLNEKIGGGYLSNLSLIVGGSLNLLLDSNFMSEMQGDSNKTLYNVLGNEKLWVFVACVLFVVACFVVYIIRFNLQKKAEKVKNDMQIEKVLSTINPNDFEDIDALMERLTSEFEKVANEKGKKDTIEPEKSQIEDEQLDNDKDNKED